MVARADCDPTVAAGTTLSRLGCQEINYQRCHWEVEYNACLANLNADLNMACMTFPDVSESNWDDFDMFPAPTDLTLVDATAYCQGTCSAPIATVTFTDRSGNGIALDGGSLAPTSGTGDNTWTTFSTSDADRNLDAGEGLRVFFTSPTSTDTITVCVRW